MKNTTNTLKSELSTQKEEEIKSNIERIISSYRHVWDVFCELLQNSADAIFEKFPFSDLNQGNILLEIFTNERKIIIKDNGIGIEEKDISKILATGKSLKREQKKGRFGFMGYGFTFIAFQSSYLKIESIRKGKKASRTYENLYKFVFENGEIPNSLEEDRNIVSQDSQDESGTTVTIIFPKEFPNETVENSLTSAFRIATNHDAIKAVVRTQTVIGYLDPVFNSSEFLNFELLVDEENLNCATGYLTIREIVKEHLKNNEDRFYNIFDYENKIIKITNDFSRTIQNQIRKVVLLEEKIDGIQIGSRNPLNVRFLIYATSKLHINQFNERFLDKEADSYDFEIKHGVWLAIAGMPLSVCLDHFEHSNYLPFTVIADIKDEAIRNDLDAGRKGISEYRMKQIADKAKEILSSHNFIRYRKYVVGGSSDSRISDPFYEPKKDLEEKLKEKRRYDSNLKHKFFPPIEEQEVISLFIELVTINYLKGYTPKILSGYQVYDGLFGYDLDDSLESRYSKDNQLGIRADTFQKHGGNFSAEILIEFKKDLNSIYTDIDKNKKNLEHINLLVCWDTDFQNRDKIYHQIRGDTLMEKDSLSNVFYGVTHQLIGANRQQPLPIIELKKVLELTIGYSIN
ncbi:ATP-binding protein [Baaleninema simplex]|uniref:ATP-binding protein n=1 Tax=Baaleninema simplex TaxID=2862350 RepID=UPI00034B9561|nr:ATP-binding protein [Baaleninema simplex]